MKNTHCRLFLNVCLMLGTIFFLSCGGGDDSPLNENDQKEDDGQKNETVIESVSNFTAKETNKANESHSGRIYTNLVYYWNGKIHQELSLWRYLISWKKMVNLLQL